MEYIDSCTYSKDQMFTKLHLSAITPTNIKNWLELKVYGVVNPGPNNQPTEGRSSSMAYAKKAISFYMPNKGAHWDDLTNRGNPTKSAMT